jgi:hypothetical protein
MKILQSQEKVARMQRRLRNLCQRISAVSLLFALVFVAPAIAAAHPAPLNKARIPRIDSRAYENLQRKIKEENDTWAGES